MNPLADFADIDCRYRFEVKPICVEVHGVAQILRLEDDSADRLGPLWFDRYVNKPLFYVLIGDKCIMSYEIRMEKKERFEISFSSRVRFQVFGVSSNQFSYC